MDTLTIDRPRDRAKRTRSATAEVKTFNLALQGGGAHGAFFVTRLIDEGQICDQSLKRMNIHAIAADAVMQKLSVMSKLNADWEFLTHLRDDGREFASRWLTENFDRVGLESTIDVHERYL